MILKELRLKKGISQKELASILNVSQSVICLYETGKRELPVKKAKALSDFFAVPWYIFYEDTAKKP